MQILLWKRDPIEEPKGKKSLSASSQNVAQGDDADTSASRQEPPPPVTLQQASQYLSHQVKKQAVKMRKGRKAMLKKVMANEQNQEVLALMKKKAIEEAKANGTYDEGGDESEAEGTCCVSSIFTCSQLSGFNYKCLVESTCL